MNCDKLTNKLKEMYEDAEYRQKKHLAIVPILFGILYISEIAGVVKDSKCKISDIARNATGYENYQTEIREGMKLAEYVQSRD